MATKTQSDRYQRTQRDIVTLAQAEMRRWWTDVDLSGNLGSVSRLAQQFVPDLLTVFSDGAAGVAADWYDEVRTDAAPGRRYRAVMADPAPVEQVRASTRWALTPLFEQGADSQAVLELLLGMTQRYIQLHARRTLLYNGQRDPVRPRWARVVRSANPCAFCRMLASRGPVYLTAESAGQHEQWHDNCWCQPEPVWRDTDVWFDYRTYEQQYIEARRAVGGDTQAILAYMRKQAGSK